MTGALAHLPRGRLESILGGAPKEQRLGCLLGRGDVCFRIGKMPLVQRSAGGPGSFFAEPNQQGSLYRGLVSVLVPYNPRFSRFHQTIKAKLGHCQASQVIHPGILAVDSI